ncbi:putative cruciform DNA binding protein [Basidiobolus meristosporus CBS 931.73]|uniref:Putative cruciform DNA binding protein n=1 Tax=Basidiobolus meristosporus CBS 931.73 TaxID=1314790 RepID=A0A1Y1YUH2_9FUNG|nr:putative cruciform DNA binding protein [Basidiobolus meristosporus CBS 931.73]|eukprot:ORY01629.1 putative cruciform DNA binding protein [Basidiobolus meristosporus CBS 931.73]
MDKINANLKSASGAVKENVGSAFGNEQMQAEGKATRTEGNAEYKKAQAEGYAQGAGEKLKGNVKDTVGSAIGNEQMQAEGKAGHAKGDARMGANS